MSVAISNQFGLPETGKAIDVQKVGLSPLAGIRVRSLEFWDAGHAVREAWLRRVIEIKEHFVFAAEDYRYLSQAQARFDVLVVGGCQTAALTEVIRQARLVFPSKIILAVVNIQLGGVIATLLNAGADDVLAVGMDVPEAQARATSLIARAAAASGPSSDLVVGLRAEPLIAEPLSPQEEKVLNVLCEHVGEIVSHKTIFERLTTNRSHKKMMNDPLIKSIVSNLRSKMVGNAKIMNKRGIGYYLTIMHSAKQDLKLIRN